MRRAIVCTGLVRNQDKFNAFLDAIATLAPSVRRDLTVIFSTWVNELNAYPEIRARLRALDCIVIEQGEPDLVLAGHALHQLMSIGVAADLLDDATYVLKFRPDLGQLRDIGIFLDSYPLPVSEESLLAPLLQHRFRYRGAFGAQPLYVNDVTYIGMLPDIRRLARLPFSFVANHVRMAPEQLYWGTPFVAAMPVLSAYFRVNYGLIFDNASETHKLQSVLIEDPLYARALALHTIIMRDCFVYFEDDKNELELADFVAHHTLEDILWGREPCPDIRHHPTALTNYFHSQIIWQLLAGGQFAKSQFGERYLAAVAEYDRKDGLAVMNDQRRTLHREAAELGERLQMALPTGPLRHIHHSDGGYLVQSRAYEWSLARGDANHRVQLEKENSALRRHIDQLNHRLSVRPGTTVAS